MDDQLHKLIPELVEYINANYAEYDGVYKVALLRSVASHIENITNAQAQAMIMAKAFEGIMK